MRPREIIFYGVEVFEGAMDELGDVKIVVKDNNKGCNP